jgi:predicted HTH transcriptional regulator
MNPHGEVPAPGTRQLDGQPASRNRPMAHGLKQIKWVKSQGIGMSCSDSASALCGKVDPALRAIRRLQRGSTGSRVP